MQLHLRYLYFLLIVLFVSSCKSDEQPQPQPGVLQLSSAQVGTYVLSPSDPANNNAAPTNQPIILSFSSPLDISSAAGALSLKTAGGTSVEFNTSFSEEDKKITATPVSPLTANTVYQLQIASTLKSTSGEIFPGITIGFSTIPGTLTITSIKAGGVERISASPLTEVPLTLSMDITFATPLDPTTINTSNIFITTASGAPVAFTFSLSEENKKLSLVAVNPLKDLSRHQLRLSAAIKGANQESIAQFTKLFYTVLDPTPKFPVISDDALLTLVEQQTFKYFWEFGHPASGMARERNTSGNIVTSGGTGFGIMAIIVAIERGFITRDEGVARLEKIVSFLEDADRFHGAWSHWIDGSTGNVIPFSTKDNGGDLVETSFLVQGLITFRQYLNPGNTEENALIDRITDLWEGVEWDWYRKDNQQVLYWHWSPNYNWDMNFALSGYFEEQITYFLAAASPTHSIPKSVYTNGYGKNGAIVKNNTYYGITLPLESPAPLFWVQYSYLGLDPHFEDDYANYWEQNVNATLINQAYCIANPQKFVGYSSSCWGLTASDNQSGYSAHSPSNDLGVITPTAALSSFPYTPDESMKALKFFYYNYGDRLWGEYGFYDAFNVTQGWTADSYLAIDQGPIIVMIENYRTGLLWDLFMSAPEVQNATEKLDFNY